MELEAILNRKIDTLFPDTHRKAEIVQILNSYGVEQHEQEPIRLRLAILKLAGNDVQQVKLNATYAKQDFRDVLVWAENPRRHGKWSMPEGSKKRKLVAADKAEYEQWLAK